MRSAHSNVLVPLLVFVGHAGKAKITQFHIPVLVDKQVRTLEVAVQHVFLVEIGHSQRYVLTNADQQLLAELFLLFMEVVKQTAA